MTDSLKPTSELPMMEDPFIAATAAKASGKKSLKQAKKDRQIGDRGLLYDVPQTPIGTPLLAVDKPRRSREARKAREGRRPGRKENRNDATEPTASP